MPLDIVNGPNSKGGTSTDGNSGRQFFSEELIESLKKCLDRKFHDDILRLHLLLSSLLRVISCTQQINVELFQTFCREESLLIAEKFP